MRLLIITTVILFAALAGAQLCPTVEPGYQRQPRPSGEPANYPPTIEPACYLQYTQATATIPSCTLCHPHKFEPWRS